MGKESFLIYKSFYKPISKLSDKQLGRLFRAIFKYQLGEIITVEEDIEIAFEFFKNQFEIDENKYHGIVERNRSNGSKGGAPKRAKNDNSDDIGTTQINPNNPVGFSEPKKADNDNEYDNDSDNEEYIHTPTKARACAHAEVEKPRKKSEPVKYSDDPELNDAIAEFVKFRKGIKKPMSDRSITLMMNKLESLSHDKHEQVQILNQSIMQGWTGLYALKDDGKSRGQPRNVNPNGFANFKQTDHSEQLGQLEKMLADELNNK